MSVLNPPEELEYATCEIAEAAIQEYAKQQGYAVSRNKLYNDKKGNCLNVEASKRTGD